MQSNFHITYSQPTFELPQKPIVLLADHASLAMVPRATAGLNSSPAMESQLINPPPSPTRVDSPDNPMSTPSNDSSDDIMNQLMDQLVHKVNLMSSYEVITNPALTSVGCGLTQSALTNNCIPVEGRYADYTVQSPLHQEVDCASAAWVILHQGILGRLSSPNPEKLRQGLFLCLDDTSLAMWNFGFK